VLAFTGAGLTRDELLDRRPADWIALPLEVDHEGVRLG
jgi:hypothetical protein